VRGFLRRKKEKEQQRNILIQGREITNALPPPLINNPLMEDCSSIEANGMLSYSQKGSMPHFLPSTCSAVHRKTGEHISCPTSKME
jgi:hypothetical protein